MNVFLTGGTGLVGSAVLKALVAKGHVVTALVRSEESAKKVDAAGATHLMANIENTEDLTEEVATYDAIIHTASPSDENSPSVDRSMATAAVAAFSNTAKTYIHTSGIWIYGSGATITEQQSFNAPTITSWRKDVEDIALSGKGMRTSIVAPAVVYGHGAGLPNVIVGAPKSDTGALTLIGDGSQHWTTIYADDLGELYVAVLENGEAGYYIGASGVNPTVRELTEAASRAAGNGDVVSESVAATNERLGVMGEALLLDQQATAAKAKALGWEPHGPTLVDELESGSYSPKA